MNTAQFNIIFYMLIGIALFVLGSAFLVIYAVQLVSYALVIACSLWGFGIVLFVLSIIDKRRIEDESEDSE